METEGGPPTTTQRPADHRPLRVAIVNDFEVVVRDLAAMLEPFSDRVEVVDTEVGGTDVVAADIALFDTFGGHRTVLARAGELVQQGDVKHVVVYTRAAASAFREVAEQLGVSAVLLKTLTGEHLVDALEAVAEGRHQNRVGKRPYDPKGDELSMREWELLALLGLGLSNEEIAAELFLGVETVRTYVHRLYTKLGVANRAEAAHSAEALGLRPARPVRKDRFSRRESQRFRRLPDDIPVARDFVASNLREMRAPSSVIAMFRLAVSELASNVIEYGSSEGWLVGLRATPDWYTMDVVGGMADPDALVFHPDEWTIAPPDQVSGRGLGIVREVMDDVYADSWRGQVRITCRIGRPVSVRQR